MTVRIDYDRCIACGACVENCAFGALELADGVTKWAHPDKCESCAVCSMVCPEEAITVLTDTGAAPGQ